MPSFNKGTIMGNLVRDPEKRQTPSGAVVVSGTIVANRNFNDSNGEKKEEACFIDYEIWGKQAETLHQYSKQGDCILFEYRLKQDKWQNDAGENRSKIKLVVLGFTFVISKKTDDSTEDNANEDVGSNF